VRQWKPIRPMSFDERANEICALRSHVSILRRQIAIYRAQVQGMRGAIGSLNAILSMESALEDDIDEQPTPLRVVPKEPA
jgi:hypothetical protein